MTDLPGGAFSLSELKAQLDTALITLETRFGLNHSNPELVAVREAGDHLFSAAIHRKFGVLAQLEPRLSYREMVEQRELNGHGR